MWEHETKQAMKIDTFDVRSWKNDKKNYIICMPSISNSFTELWDCRNDKIVFNF